MKYKVCAIGLDLRKLVLARKEGSMECSRCHGLMVRYFLVDLLLSKNGGRALRCVSCGDVVDPVILSNGGRRKFMAAVGENVETSRTFIAA